MSSSSLSFAVDEEISTEINLGQEERKARKIKACWVVFICTTLVIFMMLTDSLDIIRRYLSKTPEIYITSNRTETFGNDLAGRPIIYTFYENIDVENKNTGMSDEADQDLLRLWKEKWEEEGWDAKILDMSDAKKHPRFQEFDEKLKEVPIHGANTVYNRYCYYRWLAVAAVGGGWMSDYDLLPLNFHYPDEYFDDGRFAIYSATGNGGIPCLMSGSESEWERLAFSIVELGQKRNAKEHLFSDMMAAISVRQQDNDSYALFDLVAEVIDLEWTEETCNEYDQKLGAHFSHSALRKLGIIDFNLRPEFAAHWINEWKSTCKDLKTVDLD